MPRRRKPDSPPALVALEWSGVLVRPAPEIPVWPDAAVATALLSRLNLPISPQQLRATIHYVLTCDTPAVRLRTLAEAADTLAFRLCLDRNRRTIGALRELLARAPEPVPTEGGLAALRALRARGIRTAILTDWPPYLSLGPARPLVRATDAVLYTSEEGVALATPGIYRQLLSRHNLRPEELLVIAADAVGSIGVASKLGIRSLLVAEAPDEAPACGQLAAVGSVAEAVSWIAERFYAAAVAPPVATAPALEAGGAQDDGEQPNDEAQVPACGGDCGGSVDDADDHPGACAGAEREPAGE